MSAKRDSLGSIAIDYTPAYEQGGGIGRYVRELVAALSTYNAGNTYKLFISGYHKSDLPDIGENFLYRTTKVSPKWFSRIWHRLRLPYPVECFVGSIDLYHATDFVLPPVTTSTRTLLTVHDLSYVRVPFSANPSLKHYLDIVVPRSVHAADFVLADSLATKFDLIDLYGVSPEKVEVLLCGVNPRFQYCSFDVTTRTKYKIPLKPYIFSLGTVQPRKNYERLIEATSRIRHMGYDIDLVIAGGKGWLDNPIYGAIRTHHMESNVHFIGFADEADLPYLYSQASVFAFPSLYEGFGLPVLEAMACGTPVITSRISSLPEVAGDAAVMIDPYSVDELTDALKRVIDDSTLRDTLIAKGLQQASKFTWEKSAYQLLDIYNRLLQ